MQKRKLFFIGIFLFFFTVLTSVDILSDNITDYPKTFQNGLKAAQRAFQAEEWREALQLYQHLAKEAPEFPIVYIGEGDAAAKLKDYPTAIAAFQRGLRLFSVQRQGDVAKSRLQVMVQAKLATAYHRNKQLDEADMWFQKAVKGAGEDAPAAWYVALGQIETERGNLEQARRYYIVAVQLHPKVHYAAKRPHIGRWGAPPCHADTPDADGLYEGSRAG
jgi:tetratricopeptide (TPR) repeat protein